MVEFQISSSSSSIFPSNLTTFEKFSQPLFWFKYVCRARFLSFLLYIHFSVQVRLQGKVSFHLQQWIIFQFKYVCRARFLFFFFNGYILQFKYISRPRFIFIIIGGYIFWFKYVSRSRLPKREVDVLKSDLFWVTG